MHPSFSTSIAQRRRIVGHGAKVPDSTCVIRMTIDASACAKLRQLVSEACGQAFRFTRTALCADTRKMRVLLCVNESMAASILNAVSHHIPSARIVREPSRSARVAS